MAIKAIKAGGYAAVAIIAAGLLAGCQTTSSYPERHLSDLMIDDGSGAVRYLDVLGSPREPQWNDKGLPLPLGGIHKAALPNAAAWMLAFNFDGDNTLSRGEMTQAWLVKTAEWKTGKTFAPDSLTAPARTASIEITQTNLSILKGITLSVDGERTVRLVIDEVAGKDNKGANAAQKAITDMIASVNKSFAQSSSGGGDGGGGESSGGSDSGGGSSGGGDGGGGGGSGGL